MTDIVTIPTHLLSLAEWDALGDGEDVRNLELSEGMLIVTPKPLPIHQIAAHNLTAVLNQQLPDAVLAIPDVDVLLETDPPTVRAPDIVISAASVIQTGARLHSEQVDLAVEFISPGSRRADTVTKLSEYQDASIRYYWVVDLAASGEARFVAYELRDGRYEVLLRSADAVNLEVPHPISFRLSRLTARRP